MKFKALQFRSANAKRCVVDKMQDAPVAALSKTLRNLNVRFSGYAEIECCSDFMKEVGICKLQQWSVAFVAGSDVEQLTYTLPMLVLPNGKFPALVI